MTPLGPTVSFTATKGLVYHARLRTRSQLDYTVYSLTLGLYAAVRKVYERSELRKVVEREREEREGRREGEREVF